MAKFQYFRLRDGSPFKTESREVTPGGAFQITFADYRAILKGDRVGMVNALVEQADNLPAPEFEFADKAELIRLAQGLAAEVRALRAGR